jgi:hypothetical protein
VGRGVRCQQQQQFQPLSTKFVRLGLIVSTFPCINLNVVWKLWVLHAGAPVRFSAFTPRDRVTAGSACRPPIVDPTGVWFINHKQITYFRAGRFNRGSLSLYTFPAREIATLG